MHTISSIGSTDNQTYTTDQLKVLTPWRNLSVQKVGRLLAGVERFPFYITIFAIPAQTTIMYHILTHNHEPACSWCCAPCDAAHAEEHPPCHPRRTKVGGLRPLATVHHRTTEHQEAQPPREMRSAPCTRPFNDCNLRCRCHAPPRCQPPLASPRARAQCPSCHRPPSPALGGRCACAKLPRGVEVDEQGRPLGLGSKSP